MLNGHNYILEFESEHGNNYIIVSCAFKVHLTFTDWIRQVKIAERRRKQYQWFYQPDTHIWNNDQTLKFVCNGTS